MSHWYDRPGKIPSQAGFEPRIFRSRSGRLNHYANEAAPKIHCTRLMGRLKTTTTTTTTSTKLLIVHYDEMRTLGKLTIITSVDSNALCCSPLLSCRRKRDTKLKVWNCRLRFLFFITFSRFQGPVHQKLFLNLRS